MAYHVDSSETDELANDHTTDPGTVSPAAISLALEAAAQNERVAAEAESFLKKQCTLAEKQSHLADLQAKELALELKLRHWSLQLHHASALLKLAFEVSVALVAMALAFFVGATVWSAAHADGLVIEAFSVPSDLSARGVTGEVVATRMLDRLVEMQNMTRSVRAPRSYANDWGNDLKVEIPETGVSFGEAYRYLKNWLGHETHVTGEIMRIENGMALTTRVSGQISVTYAGTEANLDTLVAKAAANVFDQTQPYRYATYLTTVGQRDEATRIFQRLATGSDNRENAWGYIGWSLSLLDTESPSTSIHLLERALALEPDNALALSNLDGAEFNLSHSERALRDATALQSILGRRAQQLIRADAITGMRLEAAGLAAYLKGNFEKAAQDQKDAASLEMGGGEPGQVNVQTAEHDLPAARAVLNAPEWNKAAHPGLSTLQEIRARMEIDSEADDWRGVVADKKDLIPLFKKHPGMQFWSLTTTTPLAAYAQARLGNIAAAEAQIAPTSADCYDCLIARARIAELRGQHARADWWFDRAVKSNPSIPFAYLDWGQALLERNQPDAAIAKFTIANQKGPHFADPLAYWGEALMAKNRSDLALAKFEEAEKYAPNWGRLHLKWGEALGYARHKDEAQKQFAQAATLDLTAAEKVEMAGMNHG